MGRVELTQEYYEGAEGEESTLHLVSVWANLNPENTYTMSLVNDDVADCQSEMYRRINDSTFATDA